MAKGQSTLDLTAKERLTQQVFADDRIRTNNIRIHSKD